MRSICFGADDKIVHILVIFVTPASLSIKCPAVTKLIKNGPWFLDSQFCLNRFCGVGLCHPGAGDVVFGVRFPVPVPTSYLLPRQQSELWESENEGFTFYSLVFLR